MIEIKKRLLFILFAFVKMKNYKNLQATSVRLSSLKTMTLKICKTPQLFEIPNCNLEKDVSKVFVQYTALKRLIQAWVEAHEEALLDQWQRAMRNEPVEIVG
jgi:hypothetical protein